MIKNSLLGNLFKTKDLPKNYVYIWKRDDGTPFYVGLGRNDRYKSLRRRNPHVLNVVNKMGGIENVAKEIIEVGSWELGCQLEIELIARFGRTDLKTGILTNKTGGGEGTINKIVSERTRLAVSKANKTRLWTEAAKKSISEKIKAREVTKETREKLSTLFKGKHRPAHVLEAMKKGATEAVAEGRHSWINTDRHKKHFKEVVQEKAKEWHASEEGVEFHKEIAKKSWQDRKSYEVKCQFCGRMFSTPVPSRAKYCHTNCKQQAGRLKKGAVVGTRPARKKLTEVKVWDAIKSKVTKET
jgi:hypothetical protein